MKVKKIRLKDVVIPERARQEYKDVPALAASLKAKGQLTPIIVNEDLVLRAGGRRMAAATLLGWDSIEAVIRKGDEQDGLEVELLENFMREDFLWHERAPLIAKIHDMYQSKHAKWGIRATADALGVGKTTVQNQLTLAKYLQIIPDLKQCSSEADAQKKISEAQEALLLAELQRRKSLKDETRAEQKADIKDLIARAQSLIDETKISRMQEQAPAVQYIVGDFFAETAGLAQGELGDHMIVECDPPYGIDLKNIKRESGGLDDYNEVPNETYPEFLRELMGRIHFITGNHTLVIFWYGANWYHTVVYEALRAGFKINVIPAIWLKLNFSGQNNQPSINLTNCYETFLLLRKGDVFLGKKAAQNVFMQNPVPASKKIHPTERPKALIKQIFTTCYQIETVKRCLVPFAGSGATLRVCEDLGIPAIGYDLSEEYFNKYALRDDLKDKVDAYLGESQGGK